MVTFAVEGPAGDDLWSPGLLVSLLALLFTVASFWWLNARQGRLRAYDPNAFAAEVGGSVTLKLRLPVVIYNTGAKPIVLQDLQLTFPDERTVFPLPWRRTLLQLQPAQFEDFELPTVQTVPGRSAECLFVEFGGPLPGFELQRRDYRVQMAARLGHRKGWRTLLDFTLRASHMTKPGDYAAYSNLPFELSKTDSAKADEAFTALMDTLEQLRRPDQPSG